MMGYTDPNQKATEIQLDAPRWVRWFKSHVGFLILCVITVCLYLYSEEQLELPWWGVVLGYLVLVALLIPLGRFLRLCDEDMERMKK